MSVLEIPQPERSSMLFTDLAGKLEAEADASIEFSIDDSLFNVIGVTCDLTGSTDIRYRFEFSNDNGATWLMVQQQANIDGLGDLNIGDTGVVTETDDLTLLRYYFPRPSALMGSFVSGEGPSGFATLPYSGLLATADKVRVYITAVTDTAGAPSITVSLRKCHPRMFFG